MGTSAEERMKSVRAPALVCMDCGLSETRRQVVFGEGNPEAEMVFIGEAPGEQEDKVGQPFVGRAGALLNQVLKETGIRRHKVYICNIVMCRPFIEQDRRIRNRPPRVGEIQACRKWLDAQLEIIKPSVILCVGGPAANSIIHKGFRMTEERGIWFKNVAGAPFGMAILHPAYVLRQEGEAFEEVRSLLVQDIAEARRKVEELWKAGQK